MEPADAVDAINRRFGTHPRARALHAKGVWARGTFTATPAATTLCRAAHLRGTAVPVLARFSNGSGDPAAPDHAPDVRGLAVKFELDGAATDLVSQSVPRFFSATPEQFIDFVRANTGRTAPVGLARFLATNPRALRALPINARALRPVRSYATTAYYGVHAFRWLDDQGRSRFVRCDWRPAAGQHHLGPVAARRLGPDYLRDALAAELPVRFTLDAQIADPGDDVDDPSAHWPADRRRVDVGVLELNQIVADPEADGSVVVFDPVRVTEGIELSDDPVLRFRPRAYSESIRRRTGA